jgi:hypothetical protein
MQIAGNPGSPESVALPQIQDLRNHSPRCGVRKMKWCSGPIAQAGVTVAFVPGSPFIESFARETEMPAGLSDTPRQFVGFSDDP